MHLSRLGFRTLLSRFKRSHPVREPFVLQADDIGGHLREAARRLAELPHCEASLEAQLLLMKATGLTREQIIAWPERIPEPQQTASFTTLVQRRLDGEPMAYIRGHQAFWTLDLHVTPDTLIPRPETELLVEVALSSLPAGDPLLVADAGTGSGAIAAALAAERPTWTLIALERSGAAAAVAAVNLARYAAANTGIVQTDWLAPIAPASLDAIVGNPPYVRQDDPHLREGDLLSEPMQALTAGLDGLDAIRTIAEQAATRLRLGGLLALEHGFDQGPAVRSILADHGFGAIRGHEDLAGHPRIAVGLRMS